MILTALCDLYDRLEGDPMLEIAPEGYSIQRISFSLVLDANGGLADIIDLRSKQGKNLVPRKMCVPGNSKPSGSGINPNFMWDNTMYFLGYDSLKGEGRSRQAFEAFRDRHLAFAKDISEPSYAWFCKFLEQWDPSHAQKLQHWDEMSGANLVVQFKGRQGYLHEFPEVKRLWESQSDREEDETIAPCLVTGEEAPIARIHPKIKGVPGAQSSGAGIVTFNFTASTSFGKEQSRNAPVSKLAAFKYTTALNHLINGSAPRKVQIGDATTVFWTAEQSPVESFFGQMISGTEDESVKDRIRNTLHDLARGVFPKDIGSAETPFFILGLAPNVGRLSVRFWNVSTIGQTLENVWRHYDDIRIAPHEDDFPALWLLLRETAIQHKDDTISPLLAGAVMRSIMTGTEYPRSLLVQLIMRIRADTDDKRKFIEKIGHRRAGMIKAILNRNWRIHQPHKQEVGMSLDLDRKEPSYVLGRLFAILEKAQSDAIPGVSATIKDRFFGAASANPVTVFPRLLKNAQNHLSKLDVGPRIHLDKQIQSVMENLAGFPQYFPIEDQGLFAIGYYHQRTSLYTKHSSTTNNEE